MSWCLLISPKFPSCLRLLVCNGARGGMILLKSFFFYLKSNRPYFNLTPLFATLLIRLSCLFTSFLSFVSFCTPSPGYSHSLAFPLLQFYVKVFLKKMEAARLSYSWLRLSFGARTLEGASARHTSLPLLSGVY